MSEADSQIRKPQYQERVVALVDVLGLKALLKEEHDGPPELALKALERLQLELSFQRSDKESGHPISGMGRTVYQRTLDDGYTARVETSGHPNPDDVQLSQFSDHLLLSCKADGFAPEHLVDRISHLLWALVATGLFARGAVVVGKIYHASSRALGPALVCAHNLESEVAVYPRVVVDAAVQALVDACPRTVEVPPEMGTPVQRSPPLRRDRDGLLYIDFLRRRLDDGQVCDGTEIWRGIRDSLVIRRNRHVGTPRILSKDNWMISYFNEVVREIPELASLEIEIPNRG